MPTAATPASARGSAILPFPDDVLPRWPWHRRAWPARRRTASPWHSEEAVGLGHRMFEPGHRQPENREECRDHERHLLQAELFGQEHPHAMVRPRRCLGRRHRSDCASDAGSCMAGPWPSITSSRMNIRQLANAPIAQITAMPRQKTRRVETIDLRGVMQAVDRGARQVTADRQHAGNGDGEDDGCQCASRDQASATAPRRGRSAAAQDSMDGSVCGDAASRRTSRNSQ